MIRAVEVVWMYRGRSRRGLCGPLWLASVVEYLYGGMSLADEEPRGQCGRDAFLCEVVMSPPLVLRSSDTVPRRSHGSVRQEQPIVYLALRQHHHRTAFS